MAPSMAGRDQPHAPIKAALTQSRETGDILPDGVPDQVKAIPFAQSWVHLMAGG